MWSLNYDYKDNYGLTDQEGVKYNDIQNEFFRMNLPKSAKNQKPEFVSHVNHYVCLERPLQFLL